MLYRNHEGVHYIHPWLHSPFVPHSSDQSKKWPKGYLCGGGGWLYFYVCLHNDNIVGGCMHGGDCSLSSFTPLCNNNHTHQPLLLSPAVCLLLLLPSHHITIPLWPIPFLPFYYRSSHSCNLLLLGLLLLTFLPYSGAAFSLMAIAYLWSSFFILHGLLFFRCVCAFGQ